MTLGASEARTITANIVRLLDKKCIHLNGRDPAWQRLFTQRGQDLENSTSALDFERTVNELLTEGGLSHVAFFHETGNRAPARYAINATFARLESDNGVGPRWIFQDVHEGGPALQRWHPSWRHPCDSQRGSRHATGAPDVRAWH